MFLHIGEGLLVKKKDIIAILDARKMGAAENSPLFFEAIKGHQLQKNHPIKSFVVVEKPQTGQARRSVHKRAGRERRKGKQPLVLFSTIASTTLQKRFHQQQVEMMDIESREMNG